jgi:hypothetical protein
MTMMQSGFTIARKRFTGAMLGLSAMLGLAGPVGATLDPAHQFITNGGFEQTTNGLGQLRRNTNVVGWTSQKVDASTYSYSFVLNASTVSTTGSPGEYGQEMLWGPGNGANNGLQNSLGGTGGNFVGADGAYHLGKLTQTITGLIVGQSYQLTFDFAGAQEYNYGNGPSTDSWYFGFENQGINQQSAVLNNSYKGFTGWQTQTFNFVATQTSDTLYFLAQGSPAGQPPFSLLDNVSLVGAYGTVSAAPEAGTWAMMLFGFGGIGMALRTRRRSLPAVA